jgi:glycosyltransferase involved in cell wall biosynthesis
MDELKLLGLLLPVFNHEKTIEQTLNSLIPQLSDSTILLIIDDASTDKSLEKIRMLADSQPNIRVIENSNNLGNIENMFYGVGLLLKDYSRLKYFSLIGPDDLYQSDWLNKGVAILDSNPSATAFQSWSEYFWSTGYKFLCKYETIEQEAKISKLNQILKLSDKNGEPIRYSNFIGGVVSVDFVREYFGKSERLLESLFLWEDLIPLLMIKRGGIVSIPEMLFRKNKNMKGAKNDHESKYPGADFSRKMNSIGAKFKALLFLELHFLAKKPAQFLIIQPLILLVVWNRSVRPKLSSLRLQILKFG